MATGDPWGLAQAFEGAPYYIDPSQIPTIRDPAVMEQMLGGMGFDPSTLAAMRAGAIQDASNAGLQSAAAMRHGLSAAGLTGSPAAAAMMGNIGRQTGAAQTDALQQISIANAMTGNQNRQFALNLAHQTALQQTQMLMNSISQNLTESGNNMRTATNQLMNQNPFNPGSGNPETSGVGPSLTGAAANIDPTKQNTQKNPLGTAPVYEQQGPSPQATADMFNSNAFSKNPYGGH